MIFTHQERFRSMDWYFLIQGRYMRRFARELLHEICQQSGVNFSDLDQLELPPEPPKSRRKITLEQFIQDLTE